MLGQVNNAFEMLRQHTSRSTSHKLPKVEILKNAIFYIESLEMLLSDHEREERDENVEEEDEKKQAVNINSETKNVDLSVTSLASSLTQQNNYKSQAVLTLFQ